MTTDITEVLVGVDRIEARMQITPQGGVLVTYRDRSIKGSWIRDTGLEVDVAARGRGSSGDRGRRGRGVTFEGQIRKMALERYNQHQRDHMDTAFFGAVIAGLFAAGGIMLVNRAARCRRIHHAVRW